MIWKKWALIPIIIPCSKCWATGASEMQLKNRLLILKKKRLILPGSCLPKFTKYLKPIYTFLYLKAMKRRDCRAMMNLSISGKKILMKTGLFSEIKKIIFGKWVTPAHVGHLRKFMWIAAAPKKKN